MCHLHESAFVTFSSDGVNDCVRRVQLDSSVDYLGCEVCYVVLYDDVGFAWTLVDMVGVMCWYALSSLASA
jgi:hypothetical protein